MSSKAWVGAVGGISCWLVTGLCQAHCRMDNDCPGDQVCESDQCVAPSALPPPPSPPGAVATPATAPLPAAAPPASATPRASIAAEPLRDPPTVEHKQRAPRYSTAMMVVGIIMTSIGPIPLFMSMAYSLGNASCGHDDYSDSRGYCRNNDTAVYGTMLLGLGLIGAGVPMIVIGAKRRPAATARVTPWASPRAAGLSLRFDL